MLLKGTKLVRLGAVHAVGLAALSFATPAHATDDPPLPVPSAAALAPTSAEPDELEPGLSSAVDAEIAPVEQESPGNMLPSAPATAQLKRIRQGWSQVISPTHAQKSPERASTDEPQRPAVAGPSYELQYHPRHVQYQRPSTARTKTRALVLPTASFSSGERTRITRSASPISSPNRPRNGAWNCALDPASNWHLDLPADDVASMQCAPDSPSDDATSDDPSDSADCSDEAGQYQHDEPQYQTPAPTTCGAADESAAPITEPEAQVPSTSGSLAAPAPPSVVSPTPDPAAAPVPPTSEPAAAPVPPTTEPAAAPVPPTHSGGDVLPAPADLPPATTNLAESRPVDRPSRPRLARSGQAPRAQRVIPAQVRPVSPSRPVRLRPVRAPSTKPKTAGSRSEAAAAPRILEPASSRVNPLGGWLLLVLPLSFAFVLGLLLLTAGIGGRSLRARLGSKGLSDHGGPGPRSSAGIRYRE
jgi:hypothetical protein